MRTLEFDEEPADELSMVLAAWIARREDIPTCLLRMRRETGTDYGYSPEGFAELAQQG